MGLFNKYSISILLVTIGSLANAQYDHDRLKPYKACKKEFNNYLEEQKDLGSGLSRGLTEMAHIYAGKPLRYEIRYREYEICMGVKTYRPYQAEVLIKMNMERKKYIDDTFSSIFEMTPNEAADNAKAAEEAAKKAAIDDVFSVLDLIDEEVRAAMEKDAKKKAAEEMIRFDWKWYRDNNEDLKTLTKEQLENHFLQYGWKEGRGGSPQDTTAWYNILSKIHVEETSNTFDWKWYRDNNEDLKTLTKEQLENHFLQYGWKEGRAGSPQDNQYEQFHAEINAQLKLHMSSFDWKWYRDNNEDLKTLTKEQLENHFLQYGFKEGRSMYEGHNPDEDVLPEALYIERHGLFKNMRGFSKNSLSVLVNYHKGLQNGLSERGKTLTDIVQKAAEEAKIATGAAAKENTDEKVPSQFEPIRKEITKLNTNDKVNNGTEKAEAYITIDLNNMLKKMNFDDTVMNKLSAIKNIKIKKLIDQTKMKTINSQGITRTMYCKPKCTLGSPMLQSNSTGINMGIPLVVYDGISEAINNSLGRVNPLRRNDIINLGIGCYKELAKTINDPNINKAMAMPAEQLEQIKTQKRKTQAGSKDNSGGSAAAGGSTAASGSTAGASAEGHHEEGHHEEGHHEEAY
jgi:hypothetical protein